jgi:hypothetical protein
MNRHDEPSRVDQMNPSSKSREIIPIEEGVIGIVLARYLPSNNPGEVHYIVELRPDKVAGETH